MRVLYFMNHVDFGGAALALYDLILQLKKMYDDYYPIVITGKNNNLNRMFDEIGVENYSANYKNFLSSYKSPVVITKPILNIRYLVGKYEGIKEIEKTIDFDTIDIIHSNLNRIDVGAILAKKYNIPHIWHFREHGDIDFKLMSLKNNPIDYINSFDSDIVFISDSVKKIWCSRGINQKKAYLIYDGVRTELYDKNVERNNNGILKVIFLGGYTKNKGQEECIEALQYIPDSKKAFIHIDFYGSGDNKYIEYLLSKAQKNRVDSLISINSYDKEIYRTLPEYNVGLTCSNAEGFGRVTVEYMLSGLCPIVSDTGANTEIVDNMVSGIVYPKGNIKELSEKLIYCINNLELIYNFGREAKKKAKCNFSMQKHAKSIMKLYKNKLHEEIL